MLNTYHNLWFAILAVSYLWRLDNSHVDCEWFSIYFHSKLVHIIRVLVVIAISKILISHRKCRVIKKVRA
jgi:hypothetical protein